MVRKGEISFWGVTPGGGGRQSQHEQGCRAPLLMDASPSLHAARIVRRTREKVGEQEGLITQWLGSWPQIVFPRGAVNSLVSLPSSTSPPNLKP